MKTKDPDYDRRAEFMHQCRLAIGEDVFRLWRKYIGAAQRRDDAVKRDHGGLIPPETIANIGTPEGLQALLAQGLITRNEEGSYFVAEWAAAEAKRVAASARFRW